MDFEIIRGGRDARENREQQEADRAWTDQQARLIGEHAAAVEQLEQLRTARRVWRENRAAVEADLMPEEMLSRVDRLEIEIDRMIEDQPVAV